MILDWEIKNFKENHKRKRKREKRDKKCCTERKQKQLSPTE